MAFELHYEQLDLIAPFAIVCDDDLVIERAGPSLRKALGADPAGARLLDAFTVERPHGIATAADIRARPGSALLLRAVERDTVVRCQPVCPPGDSRIVLFGSLALDSESDIARLGLAFGDFAPSDPTPDLLILKRSQQRSLQDLATLNAELERAAEQQREANVALADAERRYRALVEQQPLVTYIDGLGDDVVAQFSSENVLELSGYPAERWTGEPNFLFTVLHPDDLERVRAAHLESSRAGTPFRADFRIRHADGHTVWVQAEDRPVCDDDGHPLYRLGYLLDITERRTAEDEVRAAGTRLRTLIESMQAGVLLEDEHRRVTVTNEAFCSIFGIPVKPSDLIGTDCRGAAEQSKMLMAEPEPFVARIDEILRERAAVYGEEIAFADGRVFERDYVPIFVQGAYRGHLWSYRDVTPRIEAAREIRAAHDEAVAASQAKSEFLATMSHEIRTPMHGVLGAIDLLERTPLDAEQSELAAMAKGAAGGLLLVINDMLDLQKAEAGHVELAGVPVDLRALIASVADVLRVQAEAKGVALLVDVADDVPADLVGDPGRLRQILLNLVANAVKFTDEGRVEVHASVASASHERVPVALTVTDTGVGIPASAQERVFEPFAQADSSSTRRHEGTGLGLSITKQLVELMDGSITLSSTPGAGTSVTAVVVLARGAGEPVPAPAAPAPARTLAGTVLVAEDSEVNREIATRQLSRLGLASHAVASGAEAVAALEIERFDLVLMDMRMPDMDGIEATTAIRERERERGRRRTPIVAMTANALPEDRAACLDAGMDDVATKPLAVDDLCAVLGRWLDGSAGPVAPVPASGTAAPADDGASVTAAMGRLAQDLGSVTAAQEIADLWQTDLPRQLHELRTAAHAGDAARVRDAAHTLKSTSAVVGATTASTLAATVERGAATGTVPPPAQVEELATAAEHAAALVRDWHQSGAPAGPA